MHQALRGQIEKIFVVRFRVADSGSGYDVKLHPAVTLLLSVGM